MKLSKPLIFRVLRILGTAVAVLIALILVLSIFRVSIPLGFLRPKVEAAASEALGREFEMEQAPRVVIGLKPALKFEGCTIGYPSGWASERPFARLERFYIKLGLLSLLRKDLRIDDLEISGLQLNLERTADGRKNWDFGSSASEEKSDTPKPSAESSRRFSFGELRRLLIEDVGMKSYGPGGEKSVQLAFQSVEGRAASGEDLALDLTGTFQEKPFHGKLNGGTLADLIDRKGWPYEFAGDLAGASVSLAGNLGSGDLETAAEHDFTIKAPELARLEQFTGPLPTFGDVHLTGKLRFTPDGIAMPALNGNLGTTSVNGDLDINTTGEISRVSGRLDLGSIDVAVFKKPEATDGEEAGAFTKAEVEEKPEQAVPAEEGAGPGRLARIKKEGVLPFVGEVRMTIAQVLNQKVKVEHLNLGIRIEEEFATADVSVDFAEAPLRGDLEIRKHDREDDPISLDLDLVAKNADIGELVAFYTDTSGFRGNFDRLQYTIQGAGEDLPAAWSRKQVGLEVINAAMTYEGEEKTVEFQLDRGFIDGAWNRESRMGAEGRYLGEPFKVEFDKLKPERAEIAGKAPFMDLRGEAFGATFRMNGETPKNEGDPKLPLDLVASGESLGGLHRVLGVPEDAALPYSAKGTILFENGWHLDLAEGALGQTRLSGVVGSKKNGEESTLLAKLAVGTLDFRELKVLFGKAGASGDDDGGSDAEEKEEGGGGFTLDTPLLPAGVHIDDADVDLKVEKLIFEKGKVSDLDLVARFEDGWVEKAPFAFIHNGRKFEGVWAIDFRGDQPDAGLVLSTEMVDIGRILESVNAAKGFDLKAGKLSLKIHARGKTLREILVESDLAVELADGTWVVKDANTGAGMTIAIDTGSVGGKRGEKTVIDLKGKLAETPLEIVIKSDGIDALLKEEKQINLTLDAAVAGSRIEITGRALLPLDRADFDTRLTWTGEKLSDLDQLLGVDLPPVGPVSLKGRFQIVEEGYSLTDLDAKVNQTDLLGSLSVNTKGERPKVTAKLETNRFQIDDFAAKDWSPREGTAENALPGRIVAADRKFAELASPEVLGSLDADISLKAGDVRSGKDTLGGGSLKATLENGRLAIAPLKVAIPGGDFAAEMFYHPRAKDYDWRLKVKGDRFDYGVLARRKDPNTDSGGFLDVDVELENKNAPMDDFVMAHSTGHVNFEVCPEKMNAGIFDFWGANLLFALMPQIDPERNSKVNCIIGHTNIENGLMTPEVLGIDTTRVRVISEGKVDFKEDKIDLLLVPRPKRPEFLRAGTKIMVKGTFDDFDIDTGPMPILRTLSRMAGSTLLFPGNLLFQERIPEDGSDVCSCDKP